MEQHLARWSNGVSYAVEFNINDDPKQSLDNALDALRRFRQNVGNSKTVNRRWSRIAELHVRCGSNWCNPLKIKQTDTGISFSDPIYVRIIPSANLAEDEALCIKDWQYVYPLLFGALKWSEALDNFIGTVGDAIDLQLDLDDYDREIIRECNNIMHPISGGG